MNRLTRDTVIPFCKYDYVGGLDDIAARRLCTISPPAISFVHDPWRILRAVRLSARTGTRCFVCCGILTYSHTHAGHSCCYQVKTELTMLVQGLPLARRWKLPSALWARPCSKDSHQTAQ